MDVEVKHQLKLSNLCLNKPYDEDHNHSSDDKEMLSMNVWRVD